VASIFNHEEGGSRYFWNVCTHRPTTRRLTPDHFSYRHSLHAGASVLHLKENSNERQRGMVNWARVT